MAGTLYDQRMQDIVARQSAQNIKFALSVGDTVNANGNAADTASEPGQFARMTHAFSILNAAGIPFTLAAGNHDSAAVCGYGGACTQYAPDGTLIPVNTLLRDTTVFNSNAASLVSPEGVYQAGHIENSYRTYTAGGVNWLVLSLELWPRQGPLNWAKTVVASHPGHNVIVVTHSLLNADGIDYATGIDTTGTINQTFGGYGDLSSQAVYDQLILAYPNVKFAFCGHKTGVASRMDTGVNGNKVVTFLTAFHSSDFNATRFLSIDVAAGTVSSQIRASAQRVGSTAPDPNYPQYDSTITGLSFIQP